MRYVIFIAALAAASMPFTGCSGGDGESGGSSGTGGTAGTGGGGPDVALSFDETTSIPATAASAAAMEAATRFANTVSALLDLASAGGDAAAQGVSPKVLVPGFCASGQADLVLPPGPPSDWSPGDQIVLTLTDCQGSPLSSGAVSGTVTIDVEEVTTSIAGVQLDVIVDLGDRGLTGDATIDGSFAARVAVFGLEDIGFQLGKQLDDDKLTISDGALSLRLGCFEILVPPNNSIAPLAVAKLGNEVYTINDYAQNPPSITLDGDGVPSGGTLAMHGGDNSAVSVDRTGPCPDFGLAGNGSTITATFSEGGCIELSGAVHQSTSWAKLRAGDLTPGGGPECNFDITCDAVEGALELVDSEFLDSNWDTPIVSQTDGSTIEQEALRQASGGTDGGPFRQMTHVIQPATGCQNESCSMVIYHQSSLTYDPSEGAIAYINYSEAQRMIEAAFPGAAVGWAFYVEQDGTPYIALGEETAITRADWRTNSICGITPEDFTAEGLDFSLDGGPITFGYTRSNTNTSAANVQRNVHGIDEFKVVIVKEPNQ